MRPCLSTDIKFSIVKSHNTCNDCMPFLRYSGAAKRRIGMSWVCVMKNIDFCYIDNKTETFYLHSYVQINTYWFLMYKFPYLVPL